MIAIPTDHKKDMPFQEACNLVAIDGDLFKGMEALKMRKDSYTLRWHSEKDIDLYNAYNVVFKGMSKLF
tara:strand:+ start:213 stop:419 length:207 start_codon:yes stop_codon:yes gene_type:complete